MIRSMNVSPTCGMVVPPLAAPPSAGFLSTDRPRRPAVDLNELRNGVADGFTLLRKTGRPNVDVVDASLDDLLQGGAAVVEPILHELRPQRIDVEQLEVANIPLEVADALAGYGIAHRQNARRLHQLG